MKRHFKEVTYTNDLQIKPGNLPTTIDDLAKFALIGREKLVAVRAEIRAIEKVGLAQEVREQKLREAQDISEAVLDAEVRIGELMAATQKAANQYARDSGVTRKTDTLRDAGFSGSDEKIRQMAHRFETLAAHPDLVAQAKAEARENDDIVSRSLVLDKVRAKRKEEERRGRAESNERIEASRQSPQALLDTVMRQHGLDGGNMVDVRSIAAYITAPRQADFEARVRRSGREWAV